MADTSRTPSKEGATTEKEEVKDENRGSTAKQESVADRRPHFKQPMLPYKWTAKMAERAAKPSKTKTPVPDNRQRLLRKLKKEKAVLELQRGSRTYRHSRAAYRCYQPKEGEQKGEPSTDTTGKL